MHEWRVKPISGLTQTTSGPEGTGQKRSAWMETKMNITPQQISTLMEHKKRFKEAVDKLSGIIDGTGAPITAIIKGNDDGAVEEAERFAEDVLQAYDLYPEAFYSFMYDISFDDYFEMFFWNYEKDKGSPSRLDASQRTLVKSMLCCLALLGAHGPGLSQCH